MKAETKAAKPAKFNVKQWAMTNTALRHGQRCAICFASPEVVDAVRTIAEMRSRGETFVSMDQVVEMLHDRFGFDTNQTSFARHVKIHLKLQWMKRLGAS